MILRLNKIETILFSIVSVVLLVQFCLQFQLTNVGRPYESWDEIATWNLSHVFNPKAGKIRHYEYGSMDTVLQVIGNVYYKLFDPVGVNLSRYSYSNNVPESFTDHDLPYKLPVRRARVDYNYFRGVNDHQSIFLSRKIHLSFYYILLIIISYVLVRFLSYFAIPSLAALILFSVSSEFSRQSVLSLPNGGSAVSILLAFSLASVAMYTGSFLSMALSTLFLVTALHTKVDTVIFIPSIVLASAWFLYQYKKQLGWIETKKKMRTLLYLAFGSFILLKPGFFYKPYGSLMIQLDTLFGFVGTENHILSKLSEFHRFFNENFVDFSSINFGTEVLIIGLIVLVAFMGFYYAKAMPVFLVFLLAICLTWGGLIFKSTSPYDRYYVNGLGLFYLSIGLGLSFFWRSLREKYISFVAIAIVIAATPIYFSKVRPIYNASNYYKEILSYSQGYDQDFSRNKAVDYIVRMSNSLQVSKTVLVDLHGYIDIRRLIENGFDVRYINFNNFKSILSSLAPSEKYLVLFVPGSLTAISAEDDWREDEKSRYREYNRFLNKQEDIYKIAGKEMRILNAGPIQKDDAVYVKKISRFVSN